MLSSLTSFLFNGAAVPLPGEQNGEVDYYTKDAEDDWLLVDVEDTDAKSREKKKPEKSCHRASTKPFSAININLPIHQATTHETTPPASPSQMDGSWYVTPPPCFTAGGPIFVETSPLENLLIEHPSMSVYGPGSGPKRRSKGRLQNSSKKDDENTNVVGNRQLSPVPEKVVTRHKTANHIQVQHSKKGHTLHLAASLAAKTGLLEESRHLFEIQKQQQQNNQCKIKRSTTDRHNRTRLFQSSCKHPRRKNKLSLGNSYANNNRKCC